MNEDVTFDGMMALFIDFMIAIFVFFFLYSPVVLNRNKRVNRNKNS